MSQESSFHDALDAVLKDHVSGCTGLIKAERLSGGASQETYRLTVSNTDGEKLLAMRRAPGGQVLEKNAQRPGLEVEALLMQAARSVGVPEPEVFHVLSQADGVGDGFIMEWIEGEALGARIVRSPEFKQIRPQLAYECGRVLANIHHIDVDATGLRQKLWQISPEEFIEQTWERYRLLITPQPMIDYTARWLMDHLPADYEPRLVHNDFRNGNFMLSTQGIVAVLDWEAAHIGDPMRDLGWICTNSWRFGVDLPVGGFGEYDDLLRGYEEASGETVDRDRVKFWEVFGSFWWSVGCLSMAEHYRNGPDKTVERPGIARRSSECQVDCVNMLIPGPVDLIPAAESFSTIDMPSVDELVSSVRDFLRQDVMEETAGRSNFLARVASNSLDIVLRELSLGPEHKAKEHRRLAKLFDSDAGIMVLRWRLVNALRERRIDLDNVELQQHLRRTVVNQIAIDQPKYSGFKKARDYAD